MVPVLASILANGLMLLFWGQFGKTPFKGKSRDETFKQIVKAGLKFPDGISISRECRSLMKKVNDRANPTFASADHFVQLICADPKKRLGSQHGAADIKVRTVFCSVFFDR